MSGGPLRAVGGGAPGPRRVRARVEGTVQGVGFRPFVYRLAGELGLAGWVLNDERGVLIEASGPAAAVDELLVRLAADAPPLATVERVVVDELPAPRGGAGGGAAAAVGFAIVESERHGAPDALVSPDGATCDDCLRELFDPADRRYRYPFVNCTNCGPRFTIVRDVPYDRPLTTMAGFAMCAACRAEYEDPADRRFHAQPIACPDCGPRVALLDAGGAVASDDPLAEAVAALREGLVLAVKGIGGYHLACRAADARAVAALRARKHREEKPFALMAPSLAAARQLVVLGPADEALLTGRERPIVLAPRLPGAAVADAVAPRSADLGVMLPYSPLHHLLLAEIGEPLVLTSANVSDEPIAFEDADALARLAGVADRFLVHDRPIHVRTDDSVVRATAAGTVLLRRSRGYVPASVRLTVPARRPLLACGAELKSTFCVARDGRAWVGHHIGDLRNYETLASFTAGIEHFERLFAVRPEIVAHDLHPDYLSTRYALERAGVRHVAVQHHHAHLAAVLAEHGGTGPAVGAIFDGAGLGTDGTVWGGELLAGDLRGFERAGHLRAARLPGGDRAAQEPWRMAAAWLVEATGEEPPLPPALAGIVGEDRWRAVSALAASGFQAPLTTSAGRLFDAVAALCGLRALSVYEGQAAIELEACCDAGERGAYEIAVLGAEPADGGSASRGRIASGGDREPGGPGDRGAGSAPGGVRDAGGAGDGGAGSAPVGGRDGGVVLDPGAAIRAIARDAAAGVSPGAIAARFHAGLAEATAAALIQIAGGRGVGDVVLSGGVFQNRVLLERTVAALERAGLRVLLPRRLPPGDGGISYGQAAIAAARSATP